MAEFLPKNLGNGLLTGSKTTLYTVPAGRNAIVQNLNLVNTHTAPVVVNLWVDFGAGSRLVTPKDLTLQPGNKLVDGIGIALEPGDLIQGQASVNGVVDFIISGVEAV